MIWRAAFSALADLQAASGRAGESLHSFEQALAILVPLARANPSDSHTRRSLGMTLIDHGLEQDRVNQTAAALRSFREAVPILEAQVRDQRLVSDAGSPSANAVPSRPRRLAGTGASARLWSRWARSARRCILSRKP